MFTATLGFIQRAVEALLYQDSSITMDWPTIAIIGFTIGLKIILYLYCRFVSGYDIQGSEAVKAMALDNRNDIITNAFGLGMAYGAYHYEWWLDPTGAIVIGVYICYIWLGNGYGQAKQLSGPSASKEFLCALTYLAYNHHPAVVGVDTVRAWNLDYKYLVEIDIVLNPDMKLCDTHDIAEALQIKVEQLSNVARAWVHVDYEATHKPEHKLEFAGGD